MTIKKIIATSFCVLFMVASFASDARPITKAYSDCDWCGAYAATACMGSSNPPWQWHDTAGWGGSSQTVRSHVDCRSSKAWAYASAWCDPGNFPRTKVWTFTWSNWGNAGAGKDDEAFFIQIDSTDPVEAKLISVTANTASAILDGEIRASGGTVSRLVVEVYEGDTTNIIWMGSVQLGDSATTRFPPLPDTMIVVGFNTNDFNLTLVGDTAVLTFDSATSGSISLDEPFDSAGIILTFDPQVGKHLYDIPSLTPYGAAVLVVLFTATAVWLYYRRRTARA